MNQTPTLTKTARPRLGDLLHWPTNQWCKTVFQPFAYHLTLNGRNALYLSLSALDIKVGDTVLLPAFHCTALVEPFLAYGCRIQYYSVCRDLSLNFTELDELAQLPGVTALLYVHFFGLPGPSLEIRDLSTRRHLKLIEDCTHTLFSSYSKTQEEAKKETAGTKASKATVVLGSQGDVSVFSFRKILCVEDGGALVIPRKGLAGKPIHLRSPWIYHLRMLKWFLEKLQNKGIPVLTESSNTSLTTGHSEKPGADPHPIHTGILTVGPSKGPDSHEDPTFVMGYVNWTLSWPARWILAGANPSRIAQQRRNNYLRLESLLAGIPGIVPFTKGLEVGLCPMGYPFVATHYPRLDYALNKRKIPAFSFGETLHAGLDLKAFPDAVFLSQHLVMLPVHQDLKESDLQTIAREVKACLRG